MKKRGVILFLAIALPSLAIADEGMWLVHSLRGTIYKEMKKAGLKVKDTDFYNETSPALCDAIVAIDGGMGTGSMISDKGLMITNHHVAYGDIWELSTPESNYLENGFWATSQNDELPVPGKTVTFLRKVIDVTQEAKQLKEEMIAATGKWTIMSPRRQLATLEERYKGTAGGLEPSCFTFFRGEVYLMMFFETFSDVRLVGAPPQSIGSFGGETDNWGWPQHKGDFALYRVYGDMAGRPAEYSEDNVPIIPEKYLNISTKGIKDGDFAMVIGFPGRTHRYSSSFHVTEKEQVLNPIVYSCRRAKLDVIKEHMDADASVRLAYADQYTSVANYMDYARWESKCLRRYDVASIRAQEETALRQWINEDPARIEKYGNVIDRLAAGYPARKDAIRNQLYYRESWFGQSMAMNMGSRVRGFLSRIDRGALVLDSVSFQTPGIQDIYKQFARTKGTTEYNTDKDLVKNMLSGFTSHVDRSLWGDVLRQYYDRFEGDTNALGEWVYENSFCTTPEKYEAYFSVSRSVDELREDPLVALNGTMTNLTFKEAVNEAERKAGSSIDDDERLYQLAVYAYRQDKGILQYPDANSTMRVTYGHVGPVAPRDAVFYDSRSTVAGYMEKYDPDDRDFWVDGTMQSLIARKDWGRWGQKGTLYVNFLTDHDIIGGNSGSPVLNSQGNIIGLCFDGNRESMAADIYFHPTLNKGVNVDIRFVLWVIDQYAGASSLIEEMTLVK